jgi:hypothetical protein
MTDIKILHINNLPFGGGTEEVFRLTYELTRSQENLECFIGCIANDRFEPDVRFRSFKSYKGEISQVFAYIFNKTNKQLLIDFLNKNQIDVVHIHSVFAEISPSIFSALKKIPQISGLYKQFMTTRMFVLIHQLLITVKIINVWSVSLVK